MGCQILVGHLDDNRNYPETAVFVDTCTGVAFGPQMNSAEEAEKFCQWIPGDPRSYSHEDLMNKYSEFVRLYVCECGAVRDDDCPSCKEGLDFNGEGKHVDSDGDTFTCYMEAAPADGQRFECTHCVAKRAKRKAGAR